MGRKPKNPESAVTVSNPNMITDPTGEKIDKTKLAICKLHPDCFSSVEGYCTAMHAKYVGGACPFYKNRDEGVEENRKAYEQLVEKGRYDLIDKYGSTLSALGAFDPDMDRLDQMALEMEEFRQMDLQERKQLQDAGSGGA